MKILKGMPVDRPEYRIRKISRDFRVAEGQDAWRKVPSLQVRHYLWLDSPYRPRVEAKSCYSSGFLYVCFRVHEKKVRIQHTEFQSPVYKDSCVEFFVDLFPEKKLGYFNIETNAIGAMLMAFGPDRHNRRPVHKRDLQGFEISSSIRKPVDGFYGADSWTVSYRIPLRIFEKTYGGRIRPGQAARGNFFKCGDETEHPHYGAWSRIDIPRPDFHRPEFFGKVIFE